MKKKKVIQIVIVAVIVLTASVGVFIKVSQELASNERPILFVPKLMVDKLEFWQVMNQGVMTAAKEYKVEVKMLGTETESDIDGQIAILEKAIEDKPKAIILAASDYNRLVPVADKIIDAGIKLITVDSGLNGGISSSFIATDNYAAGLKAGQSLIKVIPSEATIAIVNYVKVSATAMDRERGVRDSLSSYTNIKVLDTVYSESSAQKGYEVVTELLKSEPSITGIIGLNEPSAVGAARVIKDKGLAGRIKLIGFDSSMDEIAFLEEGVLQATVVQKPFNMGYLAVQTAVQVTSGEKVNSSIDTGSEVITKDNMYTNENQKLLFPFVE